MLISKCDSDGPAEASGLPEAHGPPHGLPKVHVLQGHCTPLPPSRWPRGWAYKGPKICNIVGLLDLNY